MGGFTGHPQSAGLARYHSSSKTDADGEHRSTRSDHDGSRPHGSNQHDSNPETSPRIGIRNGASSLCAISRNAAPGNAGGISGADFRLPLLRRHDEYGSGYRDSPGPVFPDY